jgi:hypothetical protein
VEIRYTLTIPEFKEAYGAVLRRASFRHRFYYWNYTWMGLTIGLVLLGLAVLLFGTKEPNQPLIFIWVVIAFVNLAAPWRYRGLIRRSYKMQNLDAEIVVRLDPDGVTVMRPSRDITTHYGWSAFERQIESRGMFTFCPARMQFVPVPKRAMTSEQQDEFRALLAAHISGTDAKTAAARQR